MLPTYWQVLASVYLQAVLATVFAAIPLWEWYLRKRGSLPGQNRLLIFDISAATLGVFVSASEIMSIVINIAVIVFLGRKDITGEKAQNVLAHDLALFSNASYFFPAVIEGGGRPAPGGRGGRGARGGRAGGRD